jgi:3-methyladenine DNA glycosylase AlkD
MDILTRLQGLAEDDYKKFNTKIIPTSQHVLGVRIPALRKIAKEIVKQDPKTFIRLDKQNIYEMIMLEGMTLSYLDEDFLHLVPLTEQFLNKVDNWAQIDSTVCNFKNIKKEPDSVLSVVKKWLSSKEEFVVRAALVILLAHYVEKKYLNKVFTLSQKVAHQGYYVHMGNAWLISVCMAKFPEETIRFFKNSTLDSRTHNKAIQKSRESYRVSRPHKDLLTTLKK